VGEEQKDSAPRGCAFGFAASLVLWLVFFLALRALHLF